MRTPYNWMAFIDGENLTIRTQELVKKRNLKPVPGGSLGRDVFIRFPKRSWVDINRAL